MKKFILLCYLVMIYTAVPAMDVDDPWLTKVKSEFTYLQQNGEDIVEWNLDAWLGQDLAKYWIKSTGEYVRYNGESEVEQANVEFVYSRAISAYWDMQFGVRHDFKPKLDGDTRNWLSFGYIGTAPYFVSVDARVFVGEESSSQLLIELEREIMLTQQWVLTPELDFVANGETNEKYGEGSGLSEIEFGLRLGYERTRKFQPFIGITVKQTLGRTKDIEKSEGADSGSVDVMMGIHFWF